MWQAWLDRATTTPAYAYNLIKRNARPTLRDLVPTVLVAALAPLAVLAEALAGLARRGGTVAVLARRVDEAAGDGQDPVLLRAPPSTATSRTPTTGSGG